MSANSDAKGNAGKEANEFVSRLMEKVSSEEILNSDLTLHDTSLIEDSENASEGVLVGDLWGYITDVSNFIVKLYGAKDKSEIVGKHVLNFLPEGQRALEAKEAMDSIAKGVENRKRKYNITTKHGEEIPLEITISLIRDKQGQIIGFIDYVKSFTP
jgi:PAS domain S-box-containing protein